MTRVNLIPLARRQAREWRLRRNWWLAAVAGYAGLLVFALFAARSLAIEDETPLREELAHVHVTTEAAKSSTQTLQDNLHRTTTLLHANRHIADQPDWGVLLALLSRSASDGVVLRHCRVGPQGGRSRPRRFGSGGNASVLPAPIVQIDGIGRTQHDVSQYVLRLEDESLFQDVKLHDTRREPFDDGHVVAFKVDFVLDSQGGLRK